MPKKYTQSVVGGTFDRFHQGHAALIKLAAGVSEHLLIGVTTKAMVNQKTLAPYIQPFADRTQALQAYLKTLPDSPQITVIPLTDPFGPTLTDKELQAIIVSPQTLRGAQTVNRKREALGLKPLQIEVSGMVTDSVGTHLSSTRIRQGLVSRAGLVYQTLFDNDHHLTTDQKDSLRLPQGQMVDPDQLSAASLKPYAAVALVGDRVTGDFIKRHLPFQIGVIDHLVERRPYLTNLDSFAPQHHLKLVNPAGMIDSAAGQAIFSIPYGKTALIEVTGEEDLLGIPVALALPLGGVLFYGQPGQGLVKLEITEAQKESLVRLLKPV